MNADMFIWGKKKNLPQMNADMFIWGEKNKFAADER
jgi:hypothetical protein